MKHAAALIVTVLIAILTQTGLKAQSIDTDRMKRDMKVSETILKELFTPHVSKSKQAGIMYFGGNGDDVNGTYLPDYGAIFVIQRQAPNVIPQFMEGQDSSFYFKLKSRSGNNKIPITKETIIERIRHFLQTYGPTIGQLKESDRISIIYQSNSGNGVKFVNLTSKAKKKHDRNRLPAEIFVSAQKADLTTFNRGRISKKEFNNRLQVSTSEEGNSKHNDIQIMAKMLGAAFQGRENKFNITGSVRHFYVKGFGALFFADASYGTHSLVHTIMTFKKGLTVLEKSDTSKTNVKVIRAPSLKVQRGRSNKREKENFKDFLTQLKQTFVDYGRTITSISSGKSLSSNSKLPSENIFLTINMADTGNLPHTVNLLIRESVLQAYNQGDISREQAIDKVQVRKY